MDSSDDGENESLGLIDEDWQGGLYGDEDYFSDDDEYDEQEELEDDFMDQFRASVPSTASSADYQDDALLNLGSSVWGPASLQNQFEKRRKANE